MKLLLGLIARLPEGLAYGLATLTYGLLYHLFRYRRSVVAENLGHAFPEMSSEERGRVEKAAYRHLCDLMIETIRAARMRREEFAEHVSFRNRELLQEATENYSRQAIILLIHQGNWEWMLHGATMHLPIAVDPVYKPLHSEFWDEFMLTARSRFGARPMTIANVAREVIRGRKRERIIVMLADQAGPKHGGYWTDFMHRPASFYRGADKLAQTLKLPVLFAQCHRTARGRYEIEFHEISLPPHDADSEVILEKYVRKAETLIRESPETYLWTNRRWKKQPPQENTPVAAGAQASAETDNS